MADDIFDIPIDADDIAQFAINASKLVEADEAKWHMACRKLANSPEGKRWLRLAIPRYNLLGSVFCDSTDTVRAAHNDGRRHVLSEILNGAAALAQADGEDE